MVSGQRKIKREAIGYLIVVRYRESGLRIVTRCLYYRHCGSDVHDKWLRLNQRAREGPVATRVPTVAQFLEYWLREVVTPNLAPATYLEFRSLIKHVFAHRGVGVGPAG